MKNKLMVMSGWALLMVTLSLFSVTVSKEVNSATDNAAANATVITAISIGRISNLEFGTAPQGATSKVVNPGTSENPENASFQVSGHSNTTYDIILPTSVIMVTGDGVGANKQIVANNFASYPSGRGTLDGSGNQLLLAGATRAALLLDQVVGSYTASFTVEVIYN